MSKIDINNSMENSNPLFNYSNSMFNYSNPMLNNDISESETEEEFNIDEEDDFYELLNIKNGYKYEDLEGFEEIKKIIDYFDEENYFTEMKKNLNIKSFINGKTLKFDNIESFSNQIDKNIKKYYNEPKDSYINVLMITEKPSIAYTISKIISKNKFIKHNHQTMNLYNFKGIFKGIKSFFTITSVKGHIYDNEYEEKFDDDNPEESYGYNIIKTVKNKKINIPKFLNYIAKDKDILCLWIDCDPEGENICYEIIYNVWPYMNKKNYQQIYRAKFSSLAKRDIEQAFKGLKYYPNCKLSMSVDARSIIDFKVGISFTKLFTNEIFEYLNKKDLKDDLEILSYGPCQTPTLYFCVKRQKEIDKFKPSTFFRIYIEILTENNEKLKIYMDRNISNYDLAKNIVDDLRKHLYCIVDKIRIRKVIEDSPEGLKTTTMLKLASSQLNISPIEASKLAQDLYMKGFISYPRTGATKYSFNYNFENQLKLFEDDPNFGKKVKELLFNFNKRNLDFSKGVEKGGHEPIFPTRYYDKKINHKKIKEKFPLKEDHIKLYNLICLYYFASLSPPLKYEIKNYILKVGDYIFKALSSKIIQKGFLNFQPQKIKDYIVEFPSLKQNKKYNILNCDFEPNITEPPNYLTESELIDQMEKYNIGTSGTIPSHIENLNLRDYIEVNKNRQLIPTKLGIALIDSLNLIEPEIIKPENRSKIEEFVKKIETGESNYNEALKKAITFYEHKFIDCNARIDELREEFAKKFKLKEKNINKIGKNKSNEERKRKKGKEKGRRRVGYTSHLSTTFFNCNYRGRGREEEEEEIDLHFIKVFMEIINKCSLYLKRCKNVIEK